MKETSPEQLPSEEDLPQVHLGNKKYMPVLQQGGLEVRFAFEKGLPKVWGSDGCGAWMNERNLRLAVVLHQLSSP